MALSATKWPNYQLKTISNSNSADALPRQRKWPCGGHQTHLSSFKESFFIANLPSDG
jgi:hypothetical protein